MIGLFGRGPAGAELLEVRDRDTGEWRSNPIHVLDLDGERYLVAARGETGWGQNLRAAGGGRLRRGRHTEEVTVAELPDAEKPAVLGPYIQRNWRLTGDLFAVESPEVGDEELASIAPD